MSLFTLQQTVLLKTFPSFSHWSWVVGLLEVIWQLLQLKKSSMRENWQLVWSHFGSKSWHVGSRPHSCISHFVHLSFQCGTKSWQILPSWCVTGCDKKPNIFSCWHTALLDSFVFQEAVKSHQWSILIWGVKNYCLNNGKVMLFCFCFILFLVLFWDEMWCISR